MKKTSLPIGNNDPYPDIGLIDGMIVPGDARGNILPFTQADAEKSRRRYVEDDIRFYIRKNGEWFLI